MAFEKREEFFVPGRTAEVARADGWQALIMHGIGGLFFLSLWFWMDGSGPVQVGHEIYQGMFLFSPLIGLFVLGRGVFTALADRKSTRLNSSHG